MTQRTTTGGGAVDKQPPNKTAPATATIRRAPRPADRFTIISNTAIRDRVLRPADLGVLVRLLSHQDGRGVSVASVAAENGVGRDAALGSLGRLEARGYLVRLQERREDGTLGGGVYYVSDDPQSLATMFEHQGDDEDPDEPPKPENEQETSSQPQSGLPTTAQPTTADPHIRRSGERRPEPFPLPLPCGPNGNGNGQSITQQDTPPASRHPGPPPPLPSPAARATPGVQLLTRAAVDARVILRGQPLLDQGAVVDQLLAAGEDPAAIHHVLTAPYLDSTGKPVRSVAAVVAHRLAELATLARHVDGPWPRWTPQSTPQDADDDRPWLLPPRSASGASPPGRPAWCGQCDERTRQVEKSDDDGWPVPARCRACHPLEQPTQSMF
jgi:hypothetical protein